MAQMAFGIYGGEWIWLMVVCGQQSYVYPYVKIVAG